MTDITDLLALYPALTPAERARVDARVGGRVEWAEAWADARRLAALADALDVDAEDAARVAVDRRMGVEAPDADAIARARADDPALDAEAERIAARLDALESTAEDPVARFERLSGLTLAEPPAPSGDASATQPFLRPVPAPPARRLRLVLSVAAALVVVAYGGLLAVSVASVTPRQQVAALGEVEATVPGVLRGPGAVDGADRIGEALAAVEGARRSTLGLFPTYDADALDRATAALAAVAREADPASWVSQEARMALGRVLVYRGRDAEAARVLGGLVREGSYQAAAARRLLDFVRTTGAG